jgi:hypothetical protein
LTKAEALCEGEVLATEGEGYDRERVARKSVEACTDSGGSILRTRNIYIEYSDFRGFADYSSSSLKENVSQVV